MLLKINKQQTMLKENQAITLANESLELYKKDDIYNARIKATESLTKYKGVKMPYTEDGEYAYIESNDLYDAGLSYKAINSFIY